MEKIFFPRDFFIRGVVADLHAEMKFFLLAIATHKTTSACGVTTLTEFFSRSVGLDSAAVLGRAADAAARGDVVFDPATREVFLVAWFFWHRPPTGSGQDPWSRQLRAAMAAIRSDAVRAAVFDAIASAPPARLATVLLPTNLTSALPVRNDAGCWAAAEMLVYVSIFAATRGVAVVALDELAAICSLPQATVAESLATLDRAGALVWDAKTREVFLARRLRIALSSKGDQRFAAEAIVAMRGRRVRAAIRGELPRTRDELLPSTRKLLQTFGKSRKKSTASVPVDVDLDFILKKDREGGAGKSEKTRLQHKIDAVRKKAA